MECLNEYSWGMWGPYAGRKTQYSHYLPHHSGLISEISNMRSLILKYGWHLHFYCKVYSNFLFLNFYVSIILTHYFLTFYIYCYINFMLFRYFYSYFFDFYNYFLSYDTLAAYFYPLSVRSLFCLSKPLYEFLSVLYYDLILVSYEYKSPIFLEVIDSSNFLWLVYPFLFFGLLLFSLIFVLPLTLLLWGM